MTISDEGTTGQGDKAVLLAKVERTESKLVITPQRGVIKKTFVSVAWPLIGFASWLIFGHFFAHGTVWYIPWLVPFVVFLIVGTITVFAQNLIPQWPEPEFVFDRTNHKITRDGHFLGLFSNIVKVCLLERDMENGRRLRLMLVMTNFDEWKVIETRLDVSEHSSTSSLKFASAAWERYPSDRLPDSATEYELVMLANLMHDYLGLQEPAPCKHSIPYPSAIPNAMS